MLEVYPSITESEFASACSSFHKKCYDRLHGTPWLSVVWTGYELRIRQTRKPPIESRSSSEPSLAVNGSPGPLQASDTDDKRFAELEADDDDEAVSPVRKIHTWIVADFTPAGDTSHAVQFDSLLLNHAFTNVFSASPLVHFSSNQYS